MTDILMQDGTLPFENGDLCLVDAAGEVKQHIITAMNTFYGDWILDYSRGLDYAFGMRHNEFLEHDIKKQILGVQGVKSIEAFNMDFDRKTLALKVTAAIKTDFGRIDYESRLWQ